jgi:hypothetical protein
MKGYKASYDGKCMNDFLFEVGKTYEFDGKPKCCWQGFHFCENAADVFYYYNFLWDDFVLFEINALGDLDERMHKSCTNKIEIVRIVPKEEYKDVFDPEYAKFDEQGRLIWYRHLYNGILEFKYDESDGSVWGRAVDIGEWIKIQFKQK